MDTFELDDRLVTGNELVDEQHRGIFSVIRDLEYAPDTADPAALSSLLETLHTYSIEHFTAEQDLMRTAAYPSDRLDEHCEQHRVFTERVRDLVLEYRKGRLSTVTPVAELMRTWLSDHILQLDVALVEYLKHEASGQLPDADVALDA